MLLRCLCLCASLLMLSSCAGVGQGTTDQGAPELLDPTELIVLAKRPGAEAIEVSQALGYQLRAVDELEELGDVLITLGIPEGTSIPQAIAEIEAALPGTTAGAHHLYRLQVDASLGDGLRFANAMIGWPETGCRARARIGLIDAGLAADDARLASGAVVQERFVDAGTGPRSDHGTLMAHLLTGPGRTSGPPLFSAIAVDPSRGGGDSAGVSAILKSVNWLKGQNVRVANISLAGPRNKLLNRSLSRAAEEGMIFVAAAGNQGPNAAPLFPAAFPYVIAVTAVDKSGAVYRRANRGDHIDLAAPGVDVLVETATGPRFATGTSAAAPFVTTAIAADRALLAAGVASARSRLRGEAFDLGVAGADAIFGAGLLRTPAGCRAN